MKQQEGYSVYTMLHLAMNLGKIDKDEAIDRQWEMAESLYADYEASKHNDESMSEYDCIVNYLKEKESKPQFKNMVYASDFLEWYFDSDTIRSLGNSLLHGLKARGHASISVQELFDNCGYIPRSICVDNTDSNGDIDCVIEYNLSEIKLINDLNN